MQKLGLYYADEYVAEQNLLPGQKLEADAIVDLGVEDGEMLLSGKIKDRLGIFKGDGSTNFAGRTQIIKDSLWGDNRVPDGWWNEALTPEQRTNIRGVAPAAQRKKQLMAGLGNNLVQVYRTGRAQYWVKFTFETGFELPSSCADLP